MGQSHPAPEHLAVHLDQNHVSAARMLADDDDRAPTGPSGWAQFETVGGRVIHDELRRLAALREELRRPPSAGVVVDLLNWPGPALDVTWHGAGLDGQGMRRLVPGRPGRAPPTRSRWSGTWRSTPRCPDRAPPGGPAATDWTRRHGRGASSRPVGTHRPGTEAGPPGPGRPEAHHGGGRLAAAATGARNRNAPGSGSPRPAAAAARRTPGPGALVRRADQRPGRRRPPRRRPAAHRPREAGGGGAGARRVEEEHARLLAADQDGIITLLRRMDRLPTLGWALLGAVVVTAPWTFVIGLARTYWAAPPRRRSSRPGWRRCPPAAFVFVVEMWTAVYIGPPFYHPSRSLAGLLIRSSERPGRLARTRLGRWAGAALLVLAAFAGCYAVVAAPWLWPLASAAAVAVWSLRRGWAWRRLRRGRRSPPGGPPPRPGGPARARRTPRGPAPAPGPVASTGADGPPPGRGRTAARTAGGSPARRGAGGGCGRWRAAGPAAGGAERGGRLADGPGDRWRRVRRADRRRDRTTTDTTGEQT
ncbi:hypothetical protein LT493_23105 [Streptomyces tricolor]|nr:hypothetical protein [Streptomyces tricolor]